MTSVVQLCPEKSFWCFFQDLCEFVIQCLFGFFILLTITGRNEDIIVELKDLFVFNDSFITCSGGSHHWISCNYKKWCQLSPLISW